MSTIEIILSRAMSDTKFAELLSTDPERAFADYSLNASELKRFKGISQASFEAVIAEENRSFIVIHGTVDPKVRS